MIEININVPFKTYFYDCVDSTNNVCKELAKNGEASALVIAYSQTAGKGRLGRSFFSPEGTGIYMSLLLRPAFSPEQITLITTAAAVAVSNSIEKVCNKNTRIKWVNDIYIDKKKVCGILCEAGFSGGGNSSNYVILGIGINLFSPKNSFPEDIKNKAGSIFESTIEESRLKERLIEETVTSFTEIYKKLPSKEYMKDYRAKSFIIGKTVSFNKDGQCFKGTVQDINDNAEIIIQTKDKTVTLFAGEVSLEI